MHRLKSDRRFEIDIHYMGDFQPSPAEITIFDPAASLQEIAQKIFEIAGHPVLHEGRYLAGTREDADRHRR